jgi:hypothetical protein
MAKPGRKRNTTAKRYPSGQVVHRDDKEDRERAIKRRMWLYDLSHRQASDPKAGHALGRAFLYRYITEAQYQAGREYERCWYLVAAIKGIPSPHARSIDVVNEVRGGEGRDIPEQAASAAKRKLEEMHLALGFVAFGAMYAVKSCVIDDCDVGAWPQGQVDYLKSGLSALVGLLGYQEEKVFDGENERNSS